MEPEAARHAKVEWYQGELFPRVGFIVTNLRRTAKSVVRFYNHRGTAEQIIKEGKSAPKWTRLSCHDFIDNQVRRVFARENCRTLARSRENRREGSTGKGFAEGCEMAMVSNWIDVGLGPSKTGAGDKGIPGAGKNHWPSGKSRFNYRGGYVYV
jgi:hypothetical protein